MTYPRLFSFVALLLFVSAGCMTMERSTDPSDPTAIETSQDLVFYLGTRGFVLQPSGIAPPHALSESGHQYRTDGNVVRIYEFGSAELAEEAIDDFVLDTSGGGLSAVFQHQHLMVAFNGRSSALQQTLSSALGPAVF